MNAALVIFLKTRNDRTELHSPDQHAANRDASWFFCSVMVLLLRPSGLLPKLADALLVTARTHCSTSQQHIRVPHLPFDTLPIHLNQMQAFGDSIPLR